MHVEHAHQPVTHAAVDHIQAALIDRKREPVRLFESVGNSDDVFRQRVDAIRASIAQFAWREMPFVIRIDPVRGIGEPDRVIGFHDNIVGAVETFALIRLSGDGDRTIMLP